MKQKTILTLGLLLLSGGKIIYGQTTQSAEEAARIRQRMQEQTNARNKQNGYDNDGFIPNRDVSALPPPLYKGKEKEESNLRKAFEKTKHLLVVPENYYETYKNVLKDKKVELARLQPDKNCYGKYVVSAEELERCQDVIPVSGGGSLYSFKLKLNYINDFNVVIIEGNTSFITKKPAFNFDKEVDWWDLHFVNDKFVVQNSSTRGIIAEIGDVDLSDVNLMSKEFEFLNNFKQKETLAELKLQNDELKKGINSNGFTYFNSVPVKLNSTYILRSLDYRGFRLRKTKYSDKRADLLIAFKVAGRENDGSVIILWKELKASPLPE